MQSIGSKAGRFLTGLRTTTSYPGHLTRPSNALGLQLTEIAATEVAQIQLKIILKSSRKAQLIMRRGDMWH